MHFVIFIQASYFIHLYSTTNPSPLISRHIASDLSNHAENKDLTFHFIGTASNNKPTGQWDQVSFMWVFNLAYGHVSWYTHTGLPSFYTPGDQL